MSDLQELLLAGAERVAIGNDVAALDQINGESRHLVEYAREIETTALVPDEGPPGETR